MLVENNSVRILNSLTLHRPKQLAVSTKTPAGDRVANRRGLIDQLSNKIVRLIAYLGLFLLYYNKQHKQ